MRVWITTGIERMSKTKPERMKAGRKVTTMAIWAATNCSRAIEEMRSPMPRATSMKAAEPSASRAKSPRKGTWKRPIAIATVSAMPPMPRTK